eukprot:6213522-Pleurochrysis_carterae.AAC.5
MRSGATALCIHRYTQARDIACGICASTRSRPIASRRFGCFVIASFKFFRAAKATKHVLLSDSLAVRAVEFQDEAATVDSEVKLWPLLWRAGAHQLITTKPVGLALYGRSNRKLVGSPEAAPLRSAPPRSGIVNI